MISSCSGNDWTSVDRLRTGVSKFQDTGLEAERGKGNPGAGNNGHQTPREAAWTFMLRSPFGALYE